MAGVQIGWQVGTAEAVDGLLGITDHQESAGRQRVLVILILFWRCVGAIDAGQGFVLPWIGVLKLINQGHWKLCANDGWQTTAVRMQGCMQSLQQI